jgi:hypothetical protein
MIVRSVENGYVLEIQDQVEPRTYVFVEIEALFRQLLFKLDGTGPGFGGASYGDVRVLREKPE